MAGHLEQRAMTPQLSGAVQTHLDRLSMSKHRVHLGNSQQHEARRTCVESVDDVPLYQVVRVIVFNGVQTM
jgi:hypothetical protein